MNVSRRHGFLSRELHRFKVREKLSPPAGESAHGGPDGVEAAFDGGPLLEGRPGEKSSPSKILNRRINMKMKTIMKWFTAAFSVVALLASAGLAAADQPQETQATGRVVNVNPNEHSLTLRQFLVHRTFNLGSDCAILRWDGSAGEFSDLRPGEKVTIGYRNVHGVLAANRVRQDAMLYSGVVQAIAPASRQLVLGAWNGTRTFLIADNCKVVLHDSGKSALADIKPGDHVSLVYEVTSGPDLVRQIAQPSDSFTGSIVAIDLPHRMVSAQGMFGVKQFSLVHDCSIVLDGTTEAPLLSLRPGERLTINYDQVNGVNLANRIAPAPETHGSMTAQASRP
jgi:Cu/Ag efflux protein CusF